MADSLQRKTTAFRRDGFRSFLQAAGAAETHGLREEEREKRIGAGDESRDVSWAHRRQSDEM